MLKNYKKTIIVSSLVTLLPILIGLLLWNKLPEQFATHWGMDGQADGYSSLPFAVFFPPMIMLAIQWLCIWFSAKDPGNKNRNRKPLVMVLWIVPVISNLCCVLMYALALGAEFSIANVMVVAIGLMFAVIGNYLPKCKMNATIGIKVPWAYSSPENWNATHRFGGKVWVIGGIVIALGSFLPGETAFWVMLVSILVLAFIPMIYSYCYYRRQKENGDALLPFPKWNTKVGKVSLVLLVLVLIFVVAILFTGNIDVAFEEDYFSINASYYNDLTVFYDVIEAVEYREGNVGGVSKFGFGSLRLLMGNFQNEEFGNYTRYTYYRPEACVVLTVTGEKTLVLSGETKADTNTIYQELLLKTGK